MPEGIRRAEFVGGLEREGKDSELNPDPNPNRTQAQRKINSRSQLYLSGSKGFSTHFRIYQAKKKKTLQTKYHV